MPKAGSYDYPIFDIDFALAKLREAHDKIREATMDREVVAETLGMAARGGGYAYLISSMDKYGLIKTGRGKIEITELGKEAIYGSDIERERAKSKAVSKVDLFREIHSQYGPSATEEHFRAFLRQKANVDVSKVQKTAENAFKVYKKVANYISPVETPAQASIPEPAGADRSEGLTPPIEVKTQILKIQYGDVYIQLPSNDLEALALAKQAIEFMESVVRKQRNV